MQMHIGCMMLKAWIDYKKAFDMIPHSWILECLDIFKVAKNLTRLIQNSMKHWKVELTAGGEKLGEVNIREVYSRETVFVPCYSFWH